MDPRHPGTLRNRLMEGTPCSTYVTTGAHRHRFAIPLVARRQRGDGIIGRRGTASSSVPAGRHPAALRSRLDAALPRWARRLVWRRRSATPGCGRWARLRLPARPEPALVAGLLPAGARLRSL
jgi:hypothetical protein